MSSLNPEHDPIAPEPIVLKPLFVERVWGARSLEPWYVNDDIVGPLPKPIGEVWLTADTCLATSGDGRGKTLRELTAGEPERFGDPQNQGFPLLIKLLFPREKLSVQVHPNDAQAQAEGMPRGKTECWYVLDAEPGAQVAVGFNDPMTTDEVAASIKDGSIESKLRMIPVGIGDMILVDAGTVHAIGPGMVVLETQQYSDTTYRLWDYGRPRELHVEQGMAVTRTDTEAGPVLPEKMKEFTRLASSPYFIVDRFELDGIENVRLRDTDKLQILVALGEGCALILDGDHSFDLPRGQAVLLPAFGAWYSLHSGGRAEVVRILQP